MAEPISGLQFSLNNIPAAQSPTNADSVRFRFTGSACPPIYGTSGNGLTYLWKYKPFFHTGYYTTMFWGNDDGVGTLDTFFWKNGGVDADTYYGTHPYPDDAVETGVAHSWEISAELGDFTNGPNGIPVWDKWFRQALRVSGAVNAAKVHDFYWNLPDTATDVLSHTTATTWGNTNPPSPAVTFADAPWQPAHERCGGILRGWQIYNANLTLPQIIALDQCETDGQVLIAASNLSLTSALWYLNMNPQTVEDISDKSGAGHNPAWFNSNRPLLWKADGGVRGKMASSHRPYPFSPGLAR